VCKNQKISLHFSRASSPHPSAAKRKKKWKGNFWFCFAVSVSEKSNLILTFLFALFSTLTATEAHPYPRLVVILASANHTQPPTHSPLAFARAGCFGVACVRLVTSIECGGHSKKIDCAEAQTNLYVLAPPAQCAHRKPSAIADGSLEN
jgi:hypothetical protein